MSSPANDSSLLLPFATEWDLREFSKQDAGRDPAVRLLEPWDADVRADFDVPRFVESTAETFRGRARGVFSSSDYPGAPVAALLAARLGLAGPDPRAVLCASHKYCSRIAQRAVVPEAVPSFALLDPEDPRTWDSPIGFPCFVKPVKGSFSIFARRIESRQELAAFLSSEPLREYCRYYVRIFDELIRCHGVFERGASFFLAEELLHGEQATVEGWIQDGRVELLGIVDTHFHPGTKSFARFEVPSALPENVQARMREIVRKAVLGIGLDQTFFNVELLFDADRDRISIVEINPRMCGQFADLYAKVDGTSGYALACELALGKRPRPLRGAGPFAVAASIPLRVFARSLVCRVPDEEEVRAVEAQFPGTRIWIECGEGDELLRSSDVEDGASQRYGVVNLGASSRSELFAKAHDVEARLGIALEPLHPERPFGGRP